MSDPRVDLDRFYPVDEVAVIAGVRPNTVYRAIATGRLGAERRGGRLLVRGAAVAAWRATVGPAAAPGPGWLSLDEAAAAAGAHRETLLRHIRRGTVAATKVSGAWAIIRRP